jgi:glycine/D-amino acid oxidase-like deaminating enzyme
MEQDATQTGSIRVADDDSEPDTLQQSVMLLKQNLYAVDLEEATEPASLRGIRTTDDLSFDPAALIGALLNHPNITVECETEVQSIRPRAGQPAGDTPLLTVWARKHYIWAKNVILANSAHAIRLNRSLGDVISPLAMHAVDFHTEIALPTPWVLKNGEVIVQALDEHTWRMVGWTGDNEDVLARLAEAADRLCRGAPVTARHTWWVAQSQDGLPVVGQLPDAPNVYVVNGLGPWGLSWAFVAADRLVSLLIHGEDPALLGIDRFFAQ